MMLLGTGAVATKTYVDDIFSTYVYEANGSPVTIDNGINLSENGGLIWAKRRDGANSHYLADSVRGTRKYLKSDSSNAESTIPSGYSGHGLQSFNTNGYSWGNDFAFENNHSMVNFTFRKAPGFFDVVTWTGDNSSNRQISHSLKSIPGLILVKRTSSGEDWAVYHRAIGPTKGLTLNSTASEGTKTWWNNTYPTASVFTVDNSNRTNINGETYVAYLFAGGESTAATARSVDFDGSGDYLNVASASSSDLAPGTGDFTLEFWVKPDNWSDAYVELYGVAQNTGLRLVKSGNEIIAAFYGQSAVLSTTEFPAIGQWTHVALTRAGTNLSLFYNGINIKTVTNSTNGVGQGPLKIGGDSSTSFDGKISNVRFVKGTAVYTSSFRPPTEPLTNITNTKLLCCNNSSTTGSTVTPGTITANGNPTASTDSPFDDPAGFSFGDAGDQNVIKCGSYVGNGSADGAEINLGWEPQWILLKDITDDNRPWVLFDSMRGIVDEGNDAELNPNSSSAESTGNNRIKLTSTGFKFETSHGDYNGSANTYVYMCLRRPDGYCGKPPSLGTSVFAMDTGAGSSTIPNFDSGFPVDFALVKKKSSTETWYTGARLMGEQYLHTDTTGSQGNGGSVWDFDSNVGWNSYSTMSSDYQSWQWKRHTGFDVVTYTGNGVSGRQIPHSMGVAPTMMWVKRRNASRYWGVYHSGLGDNRFLLKLNESESYTNDQAAWNNTAPTSTAFTLGTSTTTNATGDDYIAMLFASVSGISSVGYYDGSSSEKFVTTGFTPRFIIIKRTNGSGGNWMVLDSLRGLGSSGNDNFLFLESNSAQGVTSSNYINTTATGFVMPGNASSDINYASGEYVYYAHA